MKSKIKSKSYEIVTLQRSAVKLARYNPRYISEENKERLRKGLKKFGMVSPLVVNRRTGNLVSGHQRLDLLDEAHKYDSLSTANDYAIEAALVDLSEKEEKALNVQLNNPSMQGDFDMPALDAFVTEYQLDPLEDLGFSPVEAELYWGSGLGEVFGDSQEVAKAKDTLGDIKDVRAAHKETTAESNSAAYYFVVVFDSPKARADFCEKTRVPESEETIAFNVLLEKIKKGYAEKG